jgi:hypothetical protein
MLSPYRVLDLTTNASAICGASWRPRRGRHRGRTPAGSPLRQEGPFRHDEADVEHSLTWWAYSRNKRGVSLDLESEAGRAALLDLVDSADFLIESFAPGYLDAGLAARISPGTAFIVIRHSVRTARAEGLVACFGPDGLGSFGRAEHYRRRRPPAGG